MRTVGTVSRGVRCPVIREGDDLVPVSYTHLDMYKRQFPDLSCAREFFLNALTHKFS